jgi:hypothetical protein
MKINIHLTDEQRNMLANLVTAEIYRLDGGANRHNSRRLILDYQEILTELNTAGS